MSKLIQFTRVFLAGLSILMISFAAEGQCPINRDSITAGDGASGFTSYQYVGSNIAQAYITDSGAGQPTRAYALIYDGNIPSRISFVNNVSDTVPSRIIWFTINSGKVVSVRDSSNSNGNPKVVVHDITYDGSGKIQSVDLDTVLTTGGGGIPGSFKNIVWGTDGNITSMNLEVTQGPVVEFTVETDNKNNIAKKLPPVDGALDILLAANANNVTGVKFVNAESIGPISAQPGQYAIEKRMSYNTNNDVCSIHFPPTVFEANKDYVIEYHYSCAGECLTSGISSANDVRNISLYPNPASDVISIENGFFTGTVKIFDASGKEAARIEAAQPLSSLNISKLQPGMYYVEFTDGQKTYRGKVLKN